MKDPMRMIERFAYQHPRFGIPNLMRYICLGNVAFWVLGVLLQNSVLLSYISFDARAILHGQVWRLVSFMFYPISGSLLFALLAFYFYYWMGSTLEQYWGTPQFNLYILIGWFFTVVYGFVVYFITGVSMPITGYYLYMSMFFSFAALFPEQQVLLFMLIPVKIKWLAYIDAAYFAVMVIGGMASFPLNLMPLVAVLNFFVFFGGELWRRRPRRESANTVNFRRESARIRREQRDQLYTHKCSVCGRTDVTNPELEFRYCSRCAGYHCFCQDHINSHIHFTE